MSDRSIEETLGLGQPKLAIAKWAGYAAIAFLVLAIGWYALVRPNGGSAIHYVTSQASIASFEVIVTATGSIEPTNLVEISSELSGTVSEVMVDYNDVVDVGTVLAELDTTKLEAQVAVQRASVQAAEARMAMAQAALDNARERFQRTFELNARGFSSAEELSTLETELIRAEAELQYSVAERSLAEANLALHQAELDQACICSPIRGVVLDRDVDAGQIVAASLSAPILFTVAEDLTQMELRVDIDEADIGFVTVGNSATFTVDAYDDRTFPAEIADIRFAPETIDGVVTYKAILAIDNTEMFLRPGMTATAEVVVAEVTEALSVPNTALRYVPPAAPNDADERSGLLGMLIPDSGPDATVADARSVWVLREGEAVEIAVQTGLSNGVLTEIVEGAIEAGDMVITDRTDG
ncbi:MAG: efflux RND transporter periplasmic adaptor subunit [Rhizobiales bacterium]|nr:efflux RND transporter periplasmic adaptor subunit [Hyphomicrobiales bacterium]MBO6700367.1 efflux RND transporter periplasmic adaptor subunit [Hyphomicrobiales bacterium]MBO6737469.1 efflux RND transporter periplasmic adaptor subunit [Hyphomicrobiales bacterium]MBO6913474.1 efflux RND transporter periplasmic adaptor subunit [Hyphomicrobiales bacterium]MBO6955405.1 efflux RND transporter periplasmic adaptor subunit [Hyphomicrobiales bacterium]